MPQKKAKPEKWQTISDMEGGSRFVRIYFPMMESAAWLALPCRTMMLYLYLNKECWLGKKKKGPTFPDIPIPAKDRNRAFYFTWNDARETGLYTGSGEKLFYLDRKNLVDHGFLEDLAPNISKGNGKAKVYMFSDKWQTWKPSGSKSERNEKTHEENF